MRHPPGRKTLFVLLVLTALPTLGCEEPAAQPSALSSAPTPSPPAPSPAPTQASPDRHESEGAKEEAKPPERVAAQHVLIAYRGAKNAPITVKRSKAEARDLAEEVRKKAESGTTFADLVAQYSEDPASRERMGSVGVFTPEKMVKPFSDAAFALSVNGVSGVVETAFGFHVIKRNQ